VPVVIYQGALNLGRGIDLLIRSMQHFPEAHLWIIGDGDITGSLKKLAWDLEVNDRVKFVGRVPLDKLWRYTARAHLGVSLEENLGLNYEYALPNKLFDYIQARIPVVVSDLPEMAAIIDRYKIGKILRKRTPENLALIMKTLLKEGSASGIEKANIELAARELCWEREEEKLIYLFKHASILA
jgi:glycosyltransferase involved in cell wall biosynthesis